MTSKKIARIASCLMRGSKSESVRRVAASDLSGRKKAIRKQAKRKAHRRAARRG